MRRSGWRQWKLKIYTRTPRQGVTTVGDVTLSPTDNIPVGERKGQGEDSGSPSSGSNDEHPGRRREREKDSSRGGGTTRTWCRAKFAASGKCCADDVCYDVERRRLGCNKRPRVSRRANMNETTPRPVARLDLCVANREEFVGTGECGFPSRDAGLTDSGGCRGTNSLSSIFDECAHVYALERLEGG